MRVVIDGRLAIGKGDDVAVANDRDVVCSDATEDAVDDGNFRTVFKSEDAHALDIVARVAMRNFRMNPLSVDHFVFDAAKGCRRAVRDLRQLPFGIVVYVLDVGRVDAYVEIPRNLLAFVEGIRVGIFVEPIDAVEGVDNAVLFEGRARGDARRVSIRIDEGAFFGVPSRGEGLDEVDREGFAGIDFVVRGDVDVELTVANDVRNTVGDEGIAVLKRDFAVVVATGVNFDRFAEGDESVVRIDDVLIGGHDNRAVKGDGGFNDVEVGRSREEVVVLAQFVDGIRRIKRVTEEIVSLFFLGFHESGVDETVDNLFDRPQRNVVEDEAASFAVVRIGGRFAGREVFANDGRGGAGEGTVLAKDDFDLHDGEAVFLSRIGVDIRLRGISVVLPEVDGRLEIAGNLRAFVDEGEVQIKLFVDEEGSDGTRLIVDRAGNNDRVFPVVDDVGTGGSRNITGQFGLGKEFVSARVYNAAAETFFTGEIGREGRVEAVHMESAVAIRANVTLVIVEIRGGVGIAEIDGGRIGVEPEVPVLPKFSRPIGHIVGAISDKLGIIGRDGRIGGVSGGLADDALSVVIDRVGAASLREEVGVARFVADERARSVGRISAFGVNVGAIFRDIARDNRVVHRDQAAVLDTAARIVRGIARDGDVDHRGDAAVFVVETAADAVFRSDDVADNRRVNQVEPTVVLILVASFAALVIDTAARLSRAVACDDRVADRQPAVMVVDTAAVICLANLIVRRLDDVLGFDGALLNHLLFARGDVAFFADKVAKGRGRDGHIVLTNATVVGVPRAADGRIAVTGSFDADVIRIADVEAVKLEVREEGVGRIAGIEEVSVGVVKLDEEVKVGVSEAGRISLSVRVREIGARADDVDNVSGVGRDKGEEVDVFRRSNDTIGDQIARMEVRARQRRGFFDIVAIVVFFVFQTTGDHC